MRVKSILKVLLLLPLLSACQSEKTSLEEPEVPVAPKRVYTVKATLPDNEHTRTLSIYGNEQTRTHITYGNTDPDWEIFQWHPVGGGSTGEDDYISIFNISRLSERECSDKIDLAAIEVKGNTAIFESIEKAKEDPACRVPNFYVKAGDVLLVTYWSTERKGQVSDGSEIFEISLEQSPQLIYDNPNISGDMTWMQGNLKMYDVVTATEEDMIPDVHFRHLSAIMRITLRNETGGNLDPKSLKFISVGEQNPFFKSYIYFGVDTNAEKGSELKVYDGTGTNGSESLSSYVSSYTNEVSGGINNYTAADTEKGTGIPQGSSYDLYVSLVPRINNNKATEILGIQLDGRIDSSNSKEFKMTIDNFDTVIEAGARYWFNLTAVDDNGVYKLVFTNQWLKDHSQQTPETGD